MARFLVLSIADRLESFKQGMHDTLIVISIWLKKGSQNWGLNFGAELKERHVYPLHTEYALSKIINILIRKSYFKMLENQISIFFVV